MTGIDSTDRPGVEQAMIPDARERALVLDPHQSFAVSAPAGSGKTELLTQRVLRLLAQVKKPEEILAITFTRKAAREMQDRIVQALFMARDEPAPVAAHRKTTWTLARNVLAQNDRQSWSLLENTHRLNIKTIDSLCMQLAQRLPLLTGLGTNTLVSEQPEKLYEQATRRLLEYLEAEGQLSRDMQLLLRHLDNNTARIETLLTKILANRDQWLRHVAGNRNTLSGFRDYLESCLDTLITETLAKLRKRCQPFERELVSCLAFASLNLQKEKPDSSIAHCVNLPGLPDSTPEQLNLWLGIVELLLTKSGQWRARLTKAEGFPPAPKGADKSVYQGAKADCTALIERLSGTPGLLELLVECRSLPSPDYNQDQWRLLGALTRLLPGLVAELLVIFSEQGCVDYPQITGSAVAALGSEDCPSDLALILDHSITHLLIDEFQDTSSSQFALLERLTEGWQPGDGHSLFIVGDGMQSCYGFRDANVGLFLAAREQGIGNAKLVPVDLKVNFRSDAGVVHWVNRTFESAFPQDNDISRGAVSYSPSIAHTGLPDLNDAVRVKILLDDGQRQREALEVARIASTIQTDYPDENTAILVRNRTHLREIIPALQHAGIGWQAVEIDPLIHRPVISDLFALTRALLNPADRVAWLAVLRAPWCGLSLADLQHLAGNKLDAGSAGHSALWLSVADPGQWTQMSQHGKTALKRLVNVIGPALRHKQRKPLRQWLEGTWLALGGPATTEPSEFAHVTSFFELLEAHEYGGIIRDMPAFGEAAERLYAKPATDPNIKLQIMTIHRAKGLEFDHVIIPGLDRSGASDPHALLLWHERLTRKGIPQLLISPIAARGADDDALYQYLKTEQALKQKLENTRLIYVAATRAIRRLYLLACARLDGNTGEISSPSKNSLLSSIWESVSDQVDLVDAETIGTRTNPGANSHIIRLKTDWQLPDLPPGNLLSQFRGHEYHDADVTGDIQLATRLQDPIRFKRPYLLMLQQYQQYQQHEGLILKGIPGALSGIAGMLETDLNEQKLLETALEKTLSDNAGQWLSGLSSDGKNSYSRPRFNTRINTCKDNRIQKINIPLTFLSENTIWLIEFDFNFRDIDQLKPNLEDTMCGYREKLRNWIDAYPNPSQRPVDAAVYFPFLQRLERYSE